MIDHLTFIIEMLVVVICIHSIYGEKFNFDLKTIVAILVMLSLTEISNAYKMFGWFSFINYIVFFIFCKIKFKSTYLETLISVVLDAIIVTSIQFICILCVPEVSQELIHYRNFFGSIIMLVLFCIMLRMKGLNRLQRSISGNNIYVVVLISFSSLVILLMLLQTKFQMFIQLEYFALIVPAIFLLLYSIVKWHTAQTEVKKMEGEFHNIKESAKDWLFEE